MQIITSTLETPSTALLIWMVNQATGTAAKIWTTNENKLPSVDNDEQEYQRKRYYKPLVALIWGRTKVGSMAGHHLLGETMVLLFIT